MDEVDKKFKERKTLTDAFVRAFSTPREEEEKMIYGNQEHWTCKDCDDVFNGETDCLKHADKYAHYIFIDPFGGDYNPCEDDELKEA